MVANITQAGVTDDLRMWVALEANPYNFNLTGTIARTLGILTVSEVFETAVGRGFGSLTQFLPVVWKLGNLPTNVYLHATVSGAGTLEALVFFFPS